MKHLNGHKHLLEVLKTANPKLRKVILQNADNKSIHAIAEIIINLMQGNVPVSKNQKQKLKKHKKILRAIEHTFMKKPINASRGRRLIVQTGGFLPAIIGLIAPIIAKAALGGVAATGAGLITKKILGQ